MPLSLFIYAIDMQHIRLIQFFFFAFVYDNVVEIVCLEMEYEELTEKCSTTYQNSLSVHSEHYLSPVKQSNVGWKG